MEPNILPHESNISCFFLNNQPTQKRRQKQAKQRITKVIEKIANESEIVSSECVGLREGER